MLIDRKPSSDARRGITVVAAAVAVCALLAGCGTGPSQAGAAAIVGTGSVSLADAQARIDSVLGRPDVLAKLTEQGNTPANIARFVVATQVQHQLLTEQARRDGIVVSDDQVSALLARPDTVPMLEQTRLAFDPASQREEARDLAVAELLARKYVDGLTVTVDVTTAGSRQEAERKARLIASGPRQADAVLTADGRNAQRNVPLRAAEVPQSAALFLFGTPAGQVVATQTGASPDVWTLVRVTRRDAVAAAAGAPPSAAVAQLGDQTLADIGRRLTQPLAEQIGVRVNPRYGNWDPLFLNVLAPEEGVSIILTGATS